MKKYNKNIIASYEKTLDNETFQVYVLDGKDYYNIHVISERFQDTENNTLKLQEPKERIEKVSEYFDIPKMISYLLEHFVWDRFYSEGIFTGHVEVSFDK
jgi:viroplasmin and RNaseH domain-containing protein